MSSLYAYTARSGDGNFVAGSLQAESLEAALMHLRTRALFVTSLEPHGSVKALAPVSFTLLPVAASARLAFFRALATLVHCGVPLHRALEVTIAQCSDGRLREALRAVAAEIESGSLLSVAMARRPREFSRLFIAMIRAGETGGVLDQVLDRLATILEVDRAVRKRLAAALAYPTIVLVASIALILFLVATIVPAFAGMFAEMHVSLPWTTRALIVVGNAMRSPGIVAMSAALPIAGILLLRAGRRVPALASLIDRWTFRVPAFGALLRKALVARIARTLGTLLRSGVPLLDALQASSEVATSVQYERMLQRVAQGLEEGHSMSSTFQESGLFDPLFLALVRVGEETGTLDAMLLRIAEYLDVDVESGIAALGSVVEPLLLLVLGAMVGTIVASVLVPLYSVIGSIK